MSNNNGNNKGVEEDYLDLLRSFNKKADAPRNEKNRDIYSDSSMEKSTGQKSGNNGVYFTNPKPTYPKTSQQRVQKQNTMELDEVSSVLRSQSRQSGKGTSVYSGSKKPKKKKKKKGLVLTALLLVFAVVFLGGGYFFFSAMGIVNDFTKAEEPEHFDGELVSESYVKNILLIGLDKEKGGSSRSDSIIICSVNKNTGKITLTSILRDTHVNIPGNDEAKINSAYAWGGANLLVQTVESAFGIKIDDYASVDFDMFTNLVDALGGINLEITEAEADYLNDGQDYKSAEKPDEFESGEDVHINGYQALWYSRIRYLDSDFMRTKRQRKVITAIADKIKGNLTPSGVFSLLDTGKAVAPFVTTTLSGTELISLATSCLSCLGKNGTDLNELVVSQKIPFENTWEYEYYWDGSSIAINLESNRELLYNTVYKGEYPETEDADY